jgi:hypothetical protein
MMIVMGVLIVVGVITLIGGIMHRMSQGTVHDAILLAEPSGTHIVSISGLGLDRMAMHLQGGGPDRVDVVDLRSGRILSRIAIAP